MSSIEHQHGGRAPLWRSLEELAGTPEFREALRRQFPAAASEWNDMVSRRRFLALMGASLGLAGYGGCGRPPAEKIVPYVTAPEGLVPGKPLFYATSMPMSGFGRGLLVESHEGRPTKVEGNPEHPASLGATDSFAQASVLQLYDPDRSKLFVDRDNVSDWGAFVDAVGARMTGVAAVGGRGLRILTETVTSPTMLDLLQQVLAKYPEARWHQYDPVNRDNVHEGTRLAFGRPLNPVYQFVEAKVILSLDSDFLFDDPGSIRYAREFIDGRRVRVDRVEMNRLYVAEPTPTITGSMADHRLLLKSSEVEVLARRIAQALGVAMGSHGLSASGFAGTGQTVPPGQSREQEPKWVGALVDDLKAHRGASLVIAGRWQPPVVHALAYAINAQLGNIGQTVVFTEPVESNAGSHRESLQQLIRDMSAGQVELLLILGGNPVYTAPADVDFGNNLLKWAQEKKPNGLYRYFAAHLGMYYDETSFLCHWHVPQNHYLESWGDVRAYDGTASIIQPLIAPLYRGRSEYDLLALLLGRLDVTPYDLVRQHWQKHDGEGPDFRARWESWLEKGVIAGTASAPQQVRAGNLATQPAISETPPAETTPAETRPAVQEAPHLAKPQAAPVGAFEIAFRPDSTIWDGSFANNAWQQELPKPLTHLTWDNAALISFKTAGQLQLKTGDVIKLVYAGRSVEAPVYAMPGQHDEVVTVHLGYGRTRAGKVGNVGFNAYALRTAAQPWFGAGLSLEKTGRALELASVRNHYLISAGGPHQHLLQPETVAVASSRPSEELEESNRRLIRVATLETFKANPNFAREMEPPPVKRGMESLFPPHRYDDYKWGMSIDTNACIGCQACVVACQAENNIPVVGKDQVLLGREMHWLRIDDYQEGGPAEPLLYHQPLPCMQCETAPCELVCPVAATVHDSEGINNMVYNRCVGTRYCSNNCPYKVRRFNFYLYGDWNDPTLKLQRNPNVSVRARGVMEKCTYCIQRIAAARIEAQKQNRRIRDGEVQTACQQVCPTRAIVFGDMNTPGSEVMKLKEQPTDYGILMELTTLPRTTYLARLRNPNPVLEKGTGTSPASVLEGAGHSQLGASPLFLRNTNPALETEHA